MCLEALPSFFSSQRLFSLDKGASNRGSYGLPFLLPLPPPYSSCARGAVEWRCVVFCFSLMRSGLFLSVSFWRGYSPRPEVFTIARHANRNRGPRHRSVGILSPLHFLFSLFTLSSLQNAVMTFEEEKMAFALATLKAAEKRCSSNSPITTGGHSSGLGGRLSSSPSFSSLQSMKSRFQGLLQGQHQQQGYTRETTKVSPRSELQRKAKKTISIFYVVQPPNNL